MLTPPDTFSGTIPRWKPVKFYVLAKVIAQSSIPPAPVATDTPSSRLETIIITGGSSMSLQASSLTILYLAIRLQTPIS